jgi:hypothetical protein
MSREPPPWRDEALSEAVADWANAELDEGDLEAERQFCTLAWDTHPGVPASEIFADAERDAVRAFEKRGDLGPLVQLLDQGHPFNSPAATFGRRPISQGLAPETSQLVADVLAGRRKRPSRRPPLTSDERRALNPIYDAEADARRLEAIIGEAYREKDKEAILNQALHAAARRWIKEFRKIERFRGIDEDALIDRLRRQYKLAPGNYRRLGGGPKPPSKKKPRRRR